MAKPQLNVGDTGLKCPGKTSVSRDCAVKSCAFYASASKKWRKNTLEFTVVLLVFSRRDQFHHCPFLNGETEEKKEKRRNDITPSLS